DHLRCQTQRKRHVLVEVRQLQSRHVTLSVQSEGRDGNLVAHPMSRTAGAGRRLVGRRLGTRWKARRISDRGTGYDRARRPLGSSRSVKSIPERGASVPQPVSREARPPAPSAKAARAIPEQALSLRTDQAEYLELVVLSVIVGILAALGNIGFRELIQLCSWIFLNVEWHALAFGHSPVRFLIPLVLLSGGAALLLLDFLFPGD